MKCKDCPALSVEGYEYPEEYCSIQPEDAIREFADGECGCLLRRSTIGKRIEENHKAFCEYCTDIGSWHVQTEEIENNPEMLCDCVTVLRELTSKQVKNPVFSSNKAARKLLFCGFIETVSDAEYTVTNKGTEWLSKYSDLDIFDVEFVVYGDVDDEESDIGPRIECNGLVELDEGEGLTIKDGRAWYSVLAGTPQDALSIATNLFEEEDFKDLAITDSSLEHIYQASQDKYYYEEDL